MQSWREGTALLHYPQKKFFIPCLMPYRPSAVQSRTIELTIQKKMRTIVPRQKTTSGYWTIPSISTLR
jgi:hypothetical protein